MKLDRSITVDENEDAVRNHIHTYLNQVGYKLVSNQSELIFERGSLLGSLTSFTPKRWHAKTIIQIKPLSDQVTEIVMNVVINTTGQVVSEKERRFWNNELDGFVTAVQTGTMDIAEFTASEKSSLVENIIVIAMVLGLTVGFAITARVVLGTQFAFNIGGLIGLAVGSSIAWQWLKSEIS